MFRSSCIEAAEMSIGLIGRKRGMTRVFTEEGDSIPVTVIEVGPNRITQIRSDEVDGYSAIQVTSGSRRASLACRPMAGHYDRAGVEAGEDRKSTRLNSSHVAISY